MEEDKMEEIIQKFANNKMTGAEALALMETLDEWDLYQDSEKREQAFKLGAVWAKNNPEQLIETENSESN